MVSTSSRSSLSAFTLLEVLLALFIFSMAVVSLVEAINGTGRTTLLARRERQVATRMESFLLEATRSPQEERSLGFQLAVGPTVKEGDVTYLIQAKPLDLTNRDNEPLRELFEVSVTARWMEGNAAQEVAASTWVFRPLFQIQQVQAPQGAPPPSGPGPIGPSPINPP